MSTLFSHFFQKNNEIRPLEAEFTEVLESIALKPRTLYFYGKLPKNLNKSGQNERPKTVAIVGSRKNTRYGEEVAYKLAYELAKNGVIVVSGLAYGIDSVAHRAALDAGGRTIAVLGTPIDYIYPKDHLPLAKEIIEKDGAIISEYAPRTPKYRDLPLAPGEYFSKTGSRGLEPKGAFLYRNRLISGLSDVVVVVEAAEKSGSLNTAAHALEQGREVFAVPGNITSPLSQGCNKLIRQGANPYTEPADILNLLFPERLKKAKKPGQLLLFGDTEEETKILKALAEGIRDGEKIAETLNLDVPTLNETLTLLEIKGMIRSLGANQWTLA